MSNKYSWFVVLFSLIIFYSTTEASGNKGVMTKSMIDNWSDMVYLYKNKNGEFPDMEGGLNLLCNNKYFNCIEKPKDLWNNDLKYYYPSKFGDQEFDLYSFGKNGIDDLGKKDDITNWSNLSELYYYPYKLILNISILISIILIIFFSVKFSKSRKKVI